MLAVRLAVFAAWGALHAPGHVAALVVLLVLSVAAPALAHLAVPRPWRASYRHRHGREGARSAYISKRQRRAVYFADRHRCVYCRSGYLLQVDHVIPWSHGGRTVFWNLMSLCGRCNRIKSDYWPGEGYRPFEGSENIVMAAAILAAERRAQYNLPRLVRAALALVA